MNRAGKLWMVLLVAAVGLWGCNQAASGANGQADKIKALQDKCVRLEDDFKSAATARDQARKQLTALQDEHDQMEEQLAALQKEVEAGKAVAKEHDDLRQQLDARTGERDTLQTRCDKMKKGLQSLLGQDDALSAPAHPPITAVGGIAGGGQ